MFTLQQMQTAHGKVKTGADFPKYVQEIKSLGLLHYTFKVADGCTVYTGVNGYEISSPPKYALKTIYGQCNAEVLYYNISMHQQGHSDFLTFCSQAAACGVECWVVDTQTMLCTYYNNSGEAMLSEPIPQL
ncbi:DUF1398 domain-containing protein [Mucilaginibacter litoreus]|uniref:DUF1398 domain-containing protein n=1 Tax=Mucilaginibacter litoreus TaxID=1048221 RepID=A0ABW3AW20_9SPHI